MVEWKQQRHQIRTFFLKKYPSLRNVLAKQQSGFNESYTKKEVANCQLAPLQRVSYLQHM